MNPQLTTITLLLSVLLFVCNGTQTNQETSSTNTKDNTEAVKESSTDQSTATVDTSPAQGVDVSQFQGDEIDFLNKVKDDLTFVICKATEGITYTDPDFSNNWKTIPEKGFIRGAYHFYHTADDPIKQADNFTHAIADINVSNIPPIVDFEGGGIDKSQSVEEIQKDLISFLNAVEFKLDRKPMIYTDIPTGNKYLNNPKFAEYALWIALYEDLKAPVLPDAWKGKSWSFWQKSSSYKIDGKKNDFDVYNGDKAALESFIKGY